MAGKMTTLVEKLNVSASVASGDDVYDACSICLEPFESGDPATVTSCNHEYHLQCILEWSQRSKECPICWRSLVLKDPTCQELLAAVEAERSLRTRCAAPPTTLHGLNDDSDDEQDSSYSDDSDFEECVLQNIFVTAIRDDNVVGREMLRSSGHEAPEFQFSRGSSVFLTDSSVHESSPNGLPARNMPSNYNNQPYNASFVSCPGNSADRTPRITYCPSPPASQGKASPSEVPSFSDTLKSKFSAASSRCKESIAKSTQGLKEKLLQNNSVKELSKEVHREMNASIAGVARIFERLDIKHTRACGTESDCCAGTSNLSLKGKTLSHNDSASIQDKSDSHDSSYDVPSSFT